VYVICGSGNTCLLLSWAECVADALGHPLWRTRDLLGACGGNCMASNPLDVLARRGWHSDDGWSDSGLDSAWLILRLEGA